MGRARLALPCAQRSSRSRCSRRSEASRRPWRRSPPATGAEGRGALKDKVTLKALAGKIVSYNLGIETLCGKIDAHGKGEARQTVIWPVTPNAGEAPLTIDGRGAFNGKQHESTTIGAIDHVTSAPSPGSYSFSITGRFNRSRTRIEGRLSLKIETSAGFFCTASDSPFVATKR